MLQGRSKYFILIFFLFSILLIISLQFYSGKSIRGLVESNKKILNEMLLQMKLQELEKDVLFMETSLNGILLSRDKQRADNFWGIIDRVQKDLSTLQNIPADERSSLVIKRLNSL
jgi:CHASE3 domain sensor protein